MRFTNKVSNSMLCGAIETMRANPNDKTREMVVQEILKAEFLCPAVFSIPPKIREDGSLDLEDGCTVDWRMLQDSKGRILLMAFTDMEQMEKWKQRSTVGESYAVTFNFLDYVSLMLHEQPDGTCGPAEGFVIDPCGLNMVMDRDKVANLAVRLQTLGKH